MTPAQHEAGSQACIQREETGGFPRRGAYGPSAQDAPPLHATPTHRHPSGIRSEGPPGCLARAASPLPAEGPGHPRVSHLCIPVPAQGVPGVLSTPHNGAPAWGHLERTKGRCLPEPVCEARGSREGGPPDCGADALLTGFSSRGDGAEIHSDLIRPQGELGRERDVNLGISYHFILELRTERRAQPDAPLILDSRL